MEHFPELEIQRRHLLEQKTPGDRKMVMAGIDRLLDEMLDRPRNVILAPLPPSAEGQTHIAQSDGQIERGCE